MNPKYKRISLKISEILMGIMIPMLLLSVCLIGFALIKGNIEGIIRGTMIIIFSIFMLIFSLSLFLILIKYRKQFELDEDFKENWPYLKLFSYSFLFFIILYGLSEILIYKNWSAVNLIVIGTGMTLIMFKNLKKKRKNQQ